MAIGIAGRGQPRLRRPGWCIGADRELSWLSHRHQRHGIDGKGSQPGQKFGATVAIPDEVVSLESAPDRDHGRFLLTLRGEERASARSVVIASGVRYRRPAIDNLDAFEGTSVPKPGHAC